MIIQIAKKEFEEIVREGRFRVTAITIFVLLVASDFREQVIEFAETWRNYFVPRMFRNEKMSTEDLETLPGFRYKTGRIDSPWLSDLLATFLFCVLLLGFSAWRYRVRSLEGIIE